MSRPVHFEIHAADPERAQRFYAEMFGWTFTKWGEGGWDYWLIKTGEDGPGIDGGMLRRMGPNPPAMEPTPVIAFVCTMMVADLDAAVAKAESLGGVTAMAKMPVGGMGWLAYVKDPESNILGLMQSDAAAA